VIDPRAIIDPTAGVGEGVQIGPWCTIGAGAELGDECEIAPHVVIKEGAMLGRGNRVGEFSSIAGSLGEDNVVRERVTIEAGAEVGSGNLLMPNAFVAGNVRIGDLVEVGALSVVEQDCPSFLVVSGVPARPAGINLPGLERSGTDPDTLGVLLLAYALLFEERVPVTDARARLAAQFEAHSEVELFLDACAAARDLNALR
jgi:UDP-N-acetylglucosamine acyltransferase